MNNIVHLYVAVRGKHLEDLQDFLTQLEKPLPAREPELSLPLSDEFFFMHNHTTPEVPLTTSVGPSPPCAVAMDHEFYDTDDVYNCDFSLVTPLPCDCPSTTSLPSPREAVASAVPELSCSCDPYDLLLLCQVRLPLALAVCQPSRPRL